MYGCGKDCLILIPFRLPQTSCFTLSLKCFSSDSDSCPDVGIKPLLQCPHPPRAGPVLLTLLFFPLVPSSYGVLPGSPPQAFPTMISSLTSPRPVSAVNSSLCPGIAHQSPDSSSQPLHLPGDLHPCPGFVWLRQGLSDSHSI